ncbi:hypothetical protein F2Q70_00005695 [Brassica cretica]|uniref:Uncharacterized protein n=1 Tax=Brassica cretica TaxID=69181 RepID=A0A8S9IU60_BRACR|nr:hypothetical protein F2Q70_00005695 [Brassica cretica]
MKPVVLLMRREVTVPRVLSLQKPVVRRPWVRGRNSLSFRQCGASRSRIWS